MSDQIVQDAEKNINSYQAKTGSSKQSDSVNESGVNEGVTSQFPGSTVQVGGTLRGENPTLPDEAGGEFNKASGKQTKAEEFEGNGGPEDKVQEAVIDRPGDQDVTANVRD